MTLIIIFAACIIICNLVDCFFINEEATFSHITGLMFATLILVISIVVNVKDKPTAMDVYRGNTTLMITYKDSVAVDSIVVFK